jgi:hypothetical protein
MVDITARIGAKGLRDLNSGKTFEVLRLRVSPLPDHSIFPGLAMNGSANLGSTTIEKESDKVISKGDQLLTHMLCHLREGGTRFEKNAQNLACPA